MSKNSIYPWLITFLSALAIYRLSYYAEHKNPPAPGYEFYSDTSVILHVDGIAQSGMNVFGMFYNIVEGSRKVFEGKHLDNGEIALTFHVNSPRPAYIYLDEEEIEIFLLPDSTLHIYLQYLPGLIDVQNIHFSGATADICYYYQEKSQQFELSRSRSRRNIIHANEFSTYARLLDTLAFHEIQFLNDYQKHISLPPYFIAFEESEILYQKAYLKLSNSFEIESTEALLDYVPINNPVAVFSYYYYLYLQAYYQHTHQTRGLSDYRYEHQTLKLDQPSAELDGETLDVFLTRMIFQHISRKELNVARQLLANYEIHFTKKKYVRFLNKSMRERRIK